MTAFYPLPEAAARLATSQSSLRRRIRSGAVVAEKRPAPGGFSWWIACPDQEPPQAAPEDTPGQPVPTHAEKLLQAHVDDLRRQVEDQARQIAQLHTLLAQAHQLALPAPAPLNGVAHDQAGVSAQTPRYETAPPDPVPAGRSWWRRFWGLA